MTLSVYLKIPYKRIEEEDAEEWRIRMDRKQDKILLGDMGYKPKNLSPLFDLL